MHTRMYMTGETEPLSLESESLKKTNKHTKIKAADGLNLAPQAGRFTHTLDPAHMLLYIWKFVEDTHFTHNTLRCVSVLNKQSKSEAKLHGDCLLR